MKNNYEIEISNLIEQLRSMRRDGIQLGKRVVNETLFEKDFYPLSLLNRNIFLIDGFCSLVEERNLVCIGALLRMQIDNCMRLYAFYIADDNNSVVKSLIDGKMKISNLKDNTGKKMTDRRLLERLSEVDSRVIGVYNQCSGYIHHSAKAFYATAHTQEKRRIVMNIGHKPDERYDHVFLECTEAFVHYTKLQHQLTIPFIEAKGRFEKQHPNA